MDLGVALAQIARLVRVLVHALNDRVQVLLRLHLQDVIRVVLHPFFLFVDRLEQICNFLNRHFVLVLNGLNHALLEQLRDAIGQSFEALYVVFEHLALRADG